MRARAEGDGGGGLGEGGGGEGDGGGGEGDGGGGEGDGGGGEGDGGLGGAEQAEHAEPAAAEGTGELLSSPDDSATTTTRNAKRERGS